MSQNLEGRKIAEAAAFWQGEKSDNHNKLAVLRKVQKDRNTLIILREQGSQILQVSVPQMKKTMKKNARLRLQNS